MAKVEFKFLDLYKSAKNMTVKRILRFGESQIIRFDINNENTKEVFSIELDKSTAIKLSKTLRTEINKITESEVDNGRK